MGKIIVLKPQQASEVIEHEGIVNLDTLYRLIGCELVDCRRLGKLEGGRLVYMWFDDEGLLNDAPANRNIGGTVIAGTILLCADDGMGESVPFADDEIEYVKVVADAWPILAEGTEKPEPKIEVFSF